MAVPPYAPPPAAAAVSPPAERVQHGIGAGRARGAGARLPLFNPATGAVTRQVVMGGEEDVRAAVASAQAAWHSWAETAPVRRARVLSRFLALLNEQRDALAALITRSEERRVGKECRSRWS